MSHVPSKTDENPLGYGAIPPLLVKFAIPAIVGFLVSSMYNIVDQIFIGHGVGMLGNAATNVAFPLTSIAMACGTFFGMGGAASFNISLGAKDKDYATKAMGTAVSSLLILGVLLCAVVLVFLEPMLWLFGSTTEVFPYAYSYTGITAIGLPFLVFTTGANFLIRADGSPMYSMLFMVTGSIINTILDPIFIFVFDMGIAGAAWATVIAQVVSGCMALVYVARFKTVSLERHHFIPNVTIAKSLFILGMAPAVNQLAMSLTQVVLNNSLTTYGAQSTYGSDIPLACVGVIAKVSMIFTGIILGISQGTQPLISFNYGAKQYDRIHKTFYTALKATLTFSIIAFLCFQIFPREIISLFGDGSELYYEFATKYFRIYLFMTFCNSIQPLTSNFFTATGQPKLGVIVSLTKQVLFLIPLLILLPMVWGIDGIMYAGPVADLTAAVTATFLVLRSLRRIKESFEVPLVTSKKD